METSASKNQISMSLGYIVLEWLILKAAIWAAAEFYENKSLNEVWHGD